MNKALSDLEEVTVWLKRSKFHIERIRTIGGYSHILRTDSEWIVNHLVRDLVQDWQQDPVNLNVKGKLVLHGHLSWIAESTAFLESKVNVFLSEPNVSIFRTHFKEHFFVQDYLIRLINRDLQVDFYLIIETIVVHSRVAQLIVHVLPDLVMKTHYHFVSVDINVSLYQRNRLC